ncbi:hypothetical protein, partial [Lysobacter sp. 22409]|uniref:hypothetical protein n=1 Tax=Lysobacter sp. 22409 TaxID=3453917 RepID=UPI003F82952E
MGNRLRVRNPGQASSNPKFRHTGSRIACLRAALAAAIVGAAAAGPALASEQNPDVDAATGTQTTYISGLVLTAATGGGVPGTSSTSITAGGQSFGGNPPTAYDPRIDLVSETFNFLTPGTLVVVAAGGQQAMGTLTYSFSRPVVNPRFHFARLGGTGAGAGFSSTFMTAPAGSTWTVIGGLLTTTLANTRLRGSSNAPTVACGDPATTSGCGTAQLNGTFTSIPLGIGIGNPTAATPGDLGADGYGVTITVDEDFSDAPTSYGMAGHVNSGLTLGASLTIDPTLPLTIPNGTAYITPAPATSPRASTNAAGDTDNAFASLPIVGVGTYSLSVPVAGFQTVSGASPQLCGWIDF